MIGGLVTGAAAVRGGYGSALAQLRRCDAVSQLLLPYNTPVLSSGNY